MVKFKVALNLNFIFMLFLCRNNLISLILLIRLIGGLMEPSQVNPYYRISYYYGSRDKGKIVLNFQSSSILERVLFKACNFKR